MSHRDDEELKPNSPHSTKSHEEKLERNRYHNAVDVLRRHFDSWIDGDIRCSLHGKIVKQGEREREREKQIMKWERERESERKRDRERDILWKWERDK